ncbi:hypothetical protein Pst134EA_020764 [Puccinia striiformis f. sp. tritici]|uniref:hypothetical protein n=1 Tax=Puccinia striiformis f. sp. tritici TaxID=168172 RepID=UPI002008BDC3|nr:hypothetical protein Pst134EA_020764 [Puccinia striiformis f. sp. tritici]KAH9456853.1 hypothetical protein Pst134EA_020764 [Puccinia striiformis f. sp. tritici]
MSPSTPRARKLNGSPPHSAGMCPPSPPPPVFSVTSAFFQSPFSVSNNHHHNNNNHNSPAVHNTKTSETVLPSICAGFELQKLIEEPEVDEQQQQQQTTTTSGVDWYASREWTPLSMRSTGLSGRRQTPVQPEDRLDRLLAEMEAVSPTTLSFSNVPLHDSSKPMSSSLSSPVNSLECWELHSLETRFQPVHHHSSSSPLRPCLKNRSTSICSSSFSEDAQFSESDSASCASGSQSSSSDPPFETIDHPSSPLDLDDDRVVRVRFADDTVEELLTWSRESYDRKGPLPIMKLNLREVIELKLIKEELGISPISPVSISPITSVSIVQSYSNSSSTSSLSPSDIGTSGSSVSLSPSSSISLSPCFSSSSELGPSPASSVNLSPASSSCSSSSSELPSQSDSFGISENPSSIIQ